MSGPPQPKSPRIIAFDRDEWARLRAAKIGPCRSCESNIEVNLHHLVPRSLGGGDVEDNLVPLCGSGTTGCHGVYENRQDGWRQVADLVFRSLSPEELDYVVAVKGHDFLARYYPLEPYVLDAPLVTPPSSDPGWGSEREPEAADAGLSGNLSAPSGRTEAIVSSSEASSRSTCPHPSLEPGEKCTCGYRKPHPKKDGSPSSRVKSYRLPADDIEAHDGLVEAAAEHVGVAGQPFAMAKVVTLGLALVLQDESLRGFGAKEAA